MIPAKFDYVRAGSVSEAIALLDKYGDEAKLLSGGHSLIPAMKLRLNRPAVLIDIGHLSELKSITEEGDEVVVGANCTHKQIATSELIASQASVLAEAARTIGDVQVRNRGTIGGSLAHADPAADYPAALLAAEAQIEVEGKNGRRKIPAADFFQGMYTTALADDEVVVAVRLPKGSQGTYEKFFQPASRFAIVGVAVVKRNGGVQVGITGASDTPYRATAVEQAYAEKGVDAAELAAEGVDMMEDHFADAAYRAHLAKVLTRKALA